MKVIELKPPELDYWVALAQGFQPTLVSMDSGIACALIEQMPTRASGIPYCPSSDWTLTGPLKERYRISTIYEIDGSVTAYRADGDVMVQGPSELIAIGRLIVAIQYGDIVPGM